MGSPATRASEVIEVDLERGQVSVRTGDEVVQHPLSSPEAFKILSRIWLRAGWDNKYVYSFTWLGRPLIQLPEDVIRIQEVIYRVQPDVIVETGIAHGGSLIFYASLCHAIGKGRVVGVDVEIRPHNREAIEQHELFPLISLVEGDSVDPATLDAVRAHVQPGESALVVLDSNHTRDHVLAELRLYSPLVGVGSYVVAADGITEDLVGAPRSQPDWAWNNPRQAALAFAAERDDFVLEEPAFEFNEGTVGERVTYWPSGYLRRVS